MGRPYAYEPYRSGRASARICALELRASLAVRGLCALRTGRDRGATLGAQRGVAYPRDSGIFLHARLVTVWRTADTRSMVWTFERAEADIVQLSEQALDKDDFCWAAGERIAKVVDFSASCWHTHDPATLLITSHITERLPFCRFELLAHNEYATDDVNLFAELATSRRKVRTLRGATRNRPDASERYRELFVPNGLDGELRAALVDGGSCWGGLIVTRGPGQPDFSGEETSFFSRLSRPLARGLRKSILTSAAHRERGPDAPGLV